MSDDNWVLIGTALDQLKRGSTPDIDGYSNAEHALLSKLRKGLIPARAASLVKKRSFKGYRRATETLRDVEIEPNFWVPEFSYSASCKEDKGDPNLICRWDWSRSWFLRGREVTDHELGLNATQTEEAVGVRINSLAFGSCFGIQPTSDAERPEIKHAKNKGGRPPKLSWEDPMAYIAALAIKGEFDLDVTASEIANNIQEWCEKTHGFGVADSTAHKYANKVKAELTQLLMQGYSAD